jgi:drug/metabolite transporter (DMT)-like permease
MVASVAIYGVNFPISRDAYAHGLTPYDLVALRFLVAGPLLLAVFLRAGGGLRNCAGIGWGRGIALAIMSGFPMSLLMFTGLMFAPAAHGAAIGPGTVTIVGVLGAWWLFGARPTFGVVAGLVGVVAGLSLLAGMIGGGPPIPYAWIGDLLFVATGLVWGLYPLLVQKWAIDGLRATAVVCVLSMTYLPLFLLFFPSGLATAPWGVILFHAVNQGVFNVILALWLWSAAVRVLGAGVAGRYPPLIPVIGTLSAIPILGEVPGPLQGLGAAFVVGSLLAIAVSKR